MSSSETAMAPKEPKVVQDLDTVAIRFAGDSGDGMQLAGTQFTTSSAIAGNDVSTLPDYPAEIRAPAGSLAGVSGFQINFSSHEIHTPGDRVNALVAMNPAALRANISDVELGGLVIVNEDAFTKTELHKAGYTENPLDDDSLRGYQVHRVPITRLTAEALSDSELGPKAVARCKNFFALGLTYWLYGRPTEPTLEWIEHKFAKNAAVADANARSLKAGYHYGETTEAFAVRYHVEHADIAPGTYRKVTGNEATAMGLIAAATLANKTLFYGSYPITPASDILHELSRYKQFGVKTFQAEDEIAAVTSVIGAAFGGAFAATGTSGPGLALKSEALGLAVMIELPMLVVNVQRGGPSTGLPTKTEQADLLQAAFGRHGECPMPIFAAASPADCFDTVIEAFRIAVRYMTPVLVLSDGYIGNGAEPWRVPQASELPRIECHHPTDPEVFQPYQRNDDLARPWAIPGTPGLEHRIGGLEKADVTGMVSYDPENHQRMIGLRAEKIARIADTLPPLSVHGDSAGDLLVLGWGSTYGAIVSAVDRVRRSGRNVSSAHLRHLNPFPANLGQVLGAFRRVLIPEVNCGQLRMLIRASYLVDAVGLNKMQGKPFLISEIEEAINRTLDSERS